MSNLLEQIVGTTVPNGYIYHTDSGTDYFYNDGSWINCKSMNRLSESKNTKMNISAAKQITEHNQKNALQIGTRYKVNEASYVYVGRGVLTKNGSFISEDEQNSVLKMITEASDVTLLQVPPGYRATLDNKTYIKREFHPGDGLSVSWSGEDGGSLSGEQAYAITKKALQDIYNYNRSNPNKIGTTVAVDQGGREKWYTFLGDGFSIGDGTNRVEKDSRGFERIFQQMDDGENAYPPKDTSRGVGSLADLKYEFEKIDNKLAELKGKKSDSDTTSTATSDKPVEVKPEVKPEDNVSTKASAPSNDSGKPSVSTASGIPDQYTVLAGDVTFQYSKENGWFTRNGKSKLTDEQKQQLTAYAKKQIAAFNNHDAVKRGDMPKIGTTVKDGDKEYTFLGQVQGYVDQFGNRLSQNSEEGAKLSQEIKASPAKPTEEPSADVEPEVASVSNDSEVSPAEEKAAEPSAKEEANSTVKPAPEVAPTPAPAKVKKPADVLPAEDKEVKASDVESKVPNGFAVQSTSGKSYYKVNGQWFNAETHKVLNSSAAKMVERNAEKVIDQHNAEFSGKRIPIGQKYTSKQGNEYTWTGEKFYDKKGRTLPATVAKQVEDRVKKDLGITEEEPASTAVPAQAAGSDVQAGNSNPQSSEPKPKATVSNINQNRMNQGPAGNDEDIDPQRHLDSANDSEPVPDDIEFDEEPGNDDTLPSDDNASTSADNQEEQSDDSQKDGESEDSFLQRLAAKIKGHKYVRRITNLLARGDDLSLMAADILLNNEQEEARKIIQSLNSNDNTQ